MTGKEVTSVYKPALSCCCRRVLLAASGDRKCYRIFHPSPELPSSVIHVIIKKTKPQIHTKKIKMHTRNTVRHAFVSFTRLTKKKLLHLSLPLSEAGGY